MTSKEFERLPRDEQLAYWESRKKGRGNERAGISGTIEGHRRRELPGGVSLRRVDDTGNCLEEPQQ